MNLQSLSIISSEPFLRDLANQLGQTGLRLAYPVKDLAECIGIGNDLIMLVSIHSKTAITQGALKDKKSAVLTIASKNDLSLMFAHALSYMGQGSKLRSSANVVVETAHLQREAAGFKNPLFVNAITYEYMWRCAARYVPNGKKFQETEGGIYDFIHAKLAAVVGTKTEVELEAMRQTVYREMNKAANLADLPTSDLKKIVDRDVIYCGQWNKAMKTVMVG